jgi:hypothetical protein
MAKPAEIEEAIVSLARAVFARKGRLLFGGHPTVSPLIAAVAGEYFKADPRRDVRPIVTFQSRFFEQRLPDETWALHRYGWTEIIWTDVVHRGSEVETREASLLGMREAMLASVEDGPVAMVAIGGMEGVLHEAEMFLARRQAWRHRPPIYAAGSTGAAAEKLAYQDSLLTDAPVRSLERRWRRRHPESEKEIAMHGFEPYAAMMQELLDDFDV